MSNYTITESNVTVYASEVGLKAFSYLVSQASNVTMYLTPFVGAAPSAGNNFIYGVGNYNILSYFGSPRAIEVDALKGIVKNGYGGIDTFTGIDVFQGTAHNDKFIGSERDEIFFTNGGSNIVIGGGGYDKVTFYDRKSSDYEITFDAEKNTYTVIHKIRNTIDTYTDITHLQFDDKSIFNPNSFGIAKNARIIGTWQAIDKDVYTDGYKPVLANTFWGRPVFGEAALEGLVGIGWAYSGFDNKATSVTRVNSILMEQLKDGSIIIANEKYLSNSATNGAGSVVIADFNQDGWDDILLLAHNESPFVAASSTAYISNKGGFDVLRLNDRVMAHDAQLVRGTDDNPLVVAKTFSGNNSLYDYSGNQFIQTLQPISTRIGGMSITVADMDNDGELEAIYGDVKLAGRDDFSIAIYPYRGSDVVTTTPLKVLTPYMSAREEYSKIESDWGAGVSHAYRVWTDDFNQDGKLDILVGVSMWKSNKVTFPSMFQMFQNTGQLNFIDVTDNFNAQFPKQSAEIDYNLQIRDIDNSGINAYISSGVFYPGDDAQQNFILLNDGTGMLYEYKRSEFIQWSKDALVFAWANGFEQANRQISKFHAYLTEQKTLSFVVEMSNGSPASYVFVQLPMNLNPTVDFKQDISVTDRNSSMNIRTWAGNDVIYSKNRSAETKIDGGFGIDAVVYNFSKNTAKVSIDGGSAVIRSGDALSGLYQDSLKSIERIQFSDVSLALDLGGNAGIIAKILGAVGGKEAVYNARYVGIGLDLIDKGMSFSDIASLALQELGYSTHEAVVNALWTNVVGAPPTADEKAPFIAMLKDGMSHGELAKLAAETSENAINIGLVGLAQNGIEYTPVEPFG